MHPKIRRDLARQLVTCTGGHGAVGDDGASLRGTPTLSGSLNDYGRSNALRSSVPAGTLGHR